MKIAIRILVFVLLLIFSRPLFATIDSTRILFIGNSITYYNNMPQMFRDIANNKGEKVTISVHAPGGTGIVDHYVNTNLYSLIRSKAWDIVILQPGSSESAGASYPVDVTVQRAHILLDSIYKNNSCTKVFLYEIPYGIPSSGGYPKYFQVQTMIRDSVTKMADSLHLQILPTGESFRAYYSTAQNMYLHGSINNIHPNANGSYLVASTMYTGVFQDSVSGTSFYASIPTDSALKFFNIVDSVVLLNKPDWRINVYNIHAEFSYVQNVQNVSFTNHSVNYSNSFWAFGDGALSNNNAPNHTYNSSATFQVKLIVDDNQCFDSAFTEVEVIPTSIEKTSAFGDCYVYPNPVNSQLNVVLNNQINSIFIYDIQGKEVWSDSQVTPLLSKIDLIGLISGIYFVVFRSKNQTYIQKVIKK